MFASLVRRDPSPSLSPVSAEMLDPVWLAAWQRRNCFTNLGAAYRLGLSVSSFRRQKTGRTRVTAQTVLLAMYTDVHRHNWLTVAETAGKLAKVNNFQR
jgi:hypothetical protein